MMYQRREWLREDANASIFAAIDEDGYPELFISDGQDMVSLMRLYRITESGSPGDTQEVKANLVLVQRLIDVLAEFHGQLLEVMGDTVTC